MVSTFEWMEWIRERFDPEETIYMGDGIFDPLVFKHVAYSIAPANAFYKTKDQVDFVTEARGGRRSREACLHILEKFFNESFDVHSLDLKRGSGAWMSKK